MKRFLKYLIFIISLLFSTLGSNAYAGITERTVLNELDLSELNQAQRTMFKKELAVYTASLDALAKSDTAQWKKAVKEMLCKIRDGFRIYKLSRDQEVEKKVADFDSTTHARVYVLTWVEDAFLNNIFLRLAQAYYETTRPESYVILKYKYVKSPTYTFDKPLLKPDKPEFEISKNISDKLNKKISELTTVCYNDLNKDLGAGCTFDDKQCGFNFNTSITSALDWFKANVSTFNSLPVNLHFLDPAGNAFSVAVRGDEFTIISSVKYGPLISFYAQSQIYEAGYNSEGDFIGYYDSKGKPFEEINYDFEKTYFVEGYEEFGSTSKSAKLKILATNSESFKTDKFASKENPKKVNILESLYSEIEKGKRENNIVIHFKKDDIREEQFVIGKFSVVLITCSDKKIELASTPEELKKKYKDIKAIEGTSVSFLENGYLVTKKGDEVTATKVSEADITKMVDRIKLGKTNDKSEILFNTEMRDGKIVTSVRALGYRDNVKANSTALADPKKQKASIGRDKIIQIQNEQTTKFNEYLLTRNVSDLLAQKPREESVKFPDDTKTVIKEASYWSTLTSITKETVSFIENVEIPRHMYDHTVGAKYNDCIINTSPFLSGGGNAVIEEALELPRTILLITDIVLKEEVRNGLVQQFSNLNVTNIKKAIVNSAVDVKDNLVGTLPVNWHWKGKILASTVIGMFGTAIVKKIDEALSFDEVNEGIEELAEGTVKKNVDDVTPDVPVKKTFVDDPFDNSGKLKSNVEFKTGEFGYTGETDNLGRINKATTENLQISTADRLPHNPNTPGKLPGDHAGHLFGDKFGGSPELDNLVSQTSQVNLSKFKKIEIQWAKSINAGKKVEVEIIVNYAGNELRPSSFNVSWKIDGEAFRLFIPNQ